MSLRTDLQGRASNLVSKLEKLPPGKVLKGYISHIRFPLFKNLEQGARIDFPFPVTALVGPNGCGKTSALHALYGAPKGYTTSEFWFSTEIDPITEGNGQPNRFIYGHWLEGRDAPVETRKARVAAGAHRRPGYFEPTKAVARDGMDLTPFPAKTPGKGQSKDRWNPVERPLLYMNFRSELSAFDKYLFWGDPKITKTIRSKHERLQIGARRLRAIIENGAATATLNSRPAVEANRDLNAGELESICYILGKSYDEARLVRHRYYGNEFGVTVRFRTSTATYSEAFAGSGELAVASLVVKLRNADPYSLVLLDEPEVSLHPSAQERLLIFLMEEALRQKLQIVFTTHSPGLVRYLPSNAIKVFHQSVNGRFGVINESHPYAAFHRLGAPLPNRIRVLVEDRLSKMIVQLALQMMDEADRALFEVAFLPGGANSYFAHRIPTLMHESDYTYLLLDGDQKPASAVPDPITIPESQNSQLGEFIRQATGLADVNLGADGGNDPNASERQHQLQRQYLGFLHRRVFYLPKSCPEQIVLDSLPTGKKCESSANAKAEIAKLVADAYGSDHTSEDIDQYARARLSTGRDSNADLQAIRALLQSILAGSGLK